MESFFKEFGLVYSQISSYDHFIQNGLVRAIRTILAVDVDIRIEKPTIKPKEAVLRNLTYEATVWAGNNQRICAIPVMVGSMLCLDNKIDPLGGYFIVNGGEKVVLPQERIASSCITVLRDGGSTITVEGRASQMYVKLSIAENGVVYVINGTSRVQMMDYLASIPDRVVIESVRGKKPDPYIDPILQRMILERSDVTTPSAVDIARVHLICRCAIRGLRLYTGLRTVDQRDHMKFKAVTGTGELLAKLFKTLLNRARYSYQKRNVKAGLDKDVVNYTTVDNILTKGLRYALNTGNWVLSPTKMVGVAQVLSRFNRISTISHLRRVNTPLNKRGKNAEVRQLHPSQFGFYCPSETPEGESCGLVKHFAMTAITSLQRDIDLPMVKQGMDYTLVVNGVYSGSVDGPEYVRLTREYRATGRLPFDISIFMDREYHEVHVQSCAGRILRPLINDRGVREFVSAEEIEHDVLIGKTHYEVDPSAIFGTTASIIPFSNHNQAPRNVYHCAMAKQAVSCSGQHSLHYPQRALVQTLGAKLIGEVDAPSGTNAIVAICTSGGFNQEDSIVMSQSAIDRGMFRTSYIRTCEEEEEENTHTGKHDRIHVEDIPNPAERVYQTDTVIPIRVAGSDGLDREESLSISRSGQDGCAIESVMLTNRNIDAPDRLVKVQYRMERVPKVGDKFCSSHGQKGVCAMTLLHEDLPFTKDGIVPDIIINPHCIPSRMTIAHLLETLQGKVGAMDGTIKDGTPFRSASMETIASDLHALGFQKHGEEVMYCGKTGKRIPCKIFIGPIQYRRLKHQVDDKIHARSRGPMSRLTRQPLEGRSREGGLRFGEMERDALLAYGASNMVNDRLFENSDPYETTVCKTCGMMMVCTCSSSNNGTDSMRIPYATKLLFQELYAMGIATRIKLDK